ncbi:hypothetical protein BX600DRAFT_158326 [Xylariales sp. PMI_506]|nr:hypothetical protein BX600DRAFT_158326 [Xylariales sp. PMI_506]
MDPRAPVPSRKRRHSKACTRCRKRKIRCDFQYPKCGSCSAAAVPCVGYDSIRGVEKPRSTISHLEDEAARLEIELQHRKDEQCSISEVANAAVERLMTRIALSVAEPTGLSCKQDIPMPLTSPYFISPSPVPFLDKLAWCESKHARSSAPQANPLFISSIPRHVIDIMLKHYCEIYRPLYPAVEEAALRDSCERAYKGDNPSHFDFFCVYITLAISTSTLMHRDEHRAKEATRRFWASALVHLEQVGLTNSWERLRALELLTHFGFLNPPEVDLTRCAAAATRLCFQLGLHREPPLSDPICQDHVALNDRRRLLWNSINVDSAIHTIQCRPFTLPTSELMTQLPDFQAQPHSSLTSHFWSMRRIECDITTDLYYPQSDPNGSSFHQLHQKMHRRLIDWYQTTRRDSKLSHCVESHPTLFHAQMLRLNRPSPRCPEPTREMHKTCITSSLALIKEFGLKDGVGQLFYSWYSVAWLVEAGICLLASVLVSMEMASGESTHLEGQDVTILVRYMQEAPLLLWKLSRRWPQISQHASVIGAVSTIVSQRLQLWSAGQLLDQSDFSSLKMRLDQMSRFSPFPARPQRANQDVLSLSNDSAETAFDNGAFQPALDFNLPIVTSMYTDTENDILSWDFGGMDSEDILLAFQ